jgi:hypothetical protein
MRPGLLQQLPSYLPHPGKVAARLYDCALRPAVLLHGDLNDENVLGSQVRSLARLCFAFFAMSVLQLRSCCLLI